MSRGSSNQNQKMHLYNTLTGELEPFSTAGGRVGVYTCGITPYDTTHLGHAFTYAVSDILIRTLAWKGFPVTYVQNVTDIDDDILKKAQQVGQDWKTVGDRWTAHFIEDMKQLNVLPPDHFPRATDVIVEIQETVQKLLENGVAYEKNGSVYFDIAAWEEFGKLSGLSKEEMLPVANERGNNPDDPDKRSPLDFVLWQAQSPGEPAWSSPWGPGRPGWHIECSTMSTKFLGETIDIHLGGSDLIFPHHECEIAQVEPITENKPFVRYWMHVAMVAYEGEKMSKSLGNLVMVRDLLNIYSPDAIRIYLAMHHYREPWEHDEGELEEAANLAKKIRAAQGAAHGAAHGAAVHVKNSEGPPLETGSFRMDFESAMNEDLNTPRALQLMAYLADMIIQAGNSNDVQGAQETLRESGSILGLRRKPDLSDPEVTAGWDKHLGAFKVHPQEREY